MRNLAQQEYFDRAYNHLLALVQSGMEFPEALWQTRTTFMFTEKAMNDLKDKYDNQ